MMAPFEGYIGITGEDLEHLHALASYKTKPSFEEAYASLPPGTPREVAEKAYRDFVKYWTPPMTPERFDAAWEWSNGEEPEHIGEQTSDVLHGVHCAAGREMERTLCGLGVEASGHRESAGAGRPIPFCSDCIAAVGTMCPICGEEVEG